nr:MAG TPA: crystallin beta/gamma motif-containing protein [Caudoviricetes sp.]
MGNVISVIDALAEEKQTGGNAEPKIMTADLAQSLYAGELRVPVNANMPRTGAMTNFMYGLIDTADAFVNDTPEQIKILGGQYDVVMGGLKGDEERIKRGRMNMDTANRNLQFNQQQRDMLMPDAAKDTFGYALGSGVASYGTMVIGGYGGSSAAKALGASAKAASRATGAAAYGTMAAMEVGGEVQERADKYVADTGDEEFKNYEPEKALKNLAAESAYGVTSVILEKYLGFGEQRRLFNLDLAKLKSPTLRATASLTKTGVKSAVSEAGTEFVQSLANMGIDLIDGTMDWEQVPDRLKQELTGWAAAAVIGGTAGVGVGIYNRSRGIRAIKEEIRGTVPDADLERTASAIFDSAAEKMADVVSVELELSSQLRNKHGSVMDSMQRAVKQAVDESGAFQDVDEDMLAEYVVDTSKLFADQVLAEANIRNVPIEEVIQASDIVYENGGIRLKSQTEGGESRVLADSSVNVEGERTDFDDKAKKAVAEVFSNPQPVETSVEETTENTVSENNIVAETIAPVLNETAEAPTAEENSISADAATSQEENIATAVLNEETPQIEENDHAEKIEDFGEKIEGARKDLWNGYKEKLSDELPEDKQKIKLSTFFPEPDYETAINNGINIDVLSAVKALHDAMPPKPKKAYKLDKWVESLKNVRLLASKLLNGEIDIKSFDTLLDNGGYVLKPFRQTVETYRILGFPEFTKANGYRIESDIYNFAEGRQLEKPEYRYRVMKGNTPVTRFFNDIQDASDALRDIINNKTSDKKVKLDLYQIRSTGELVIGKKVASGKFIDLKKGFSSIKDAREYMESHEDELIAELERKKTLPKTRREVNETRIGEEYRNGNISPAQFSETFGFRGVQFGNWVEQSRRADDLNRAYDALVDLSKILDVPTRAISLNGTLGLAFGARGTGGKEAAAAHYEPLQVVINLTKEHGAGSLAHEWFHALDNSFGVKTDNDYMSEISFTLSENVRDEVKDAFKNLKKTLEKSGLYERSKERDKTRSKDYWSTGREMAARAFESYIIDKAAERGVKNDYLANIIGEADYNDSDTFAYVKQSEKKEIYAAFDKLFDTLQTRETDNGVEFYQLPQEASDAQGKADINTPEFKEWFGNSKVVDEKGKPLEMVHFSYNEFSQFDKSHAGVNNDESSIGFWFADRDDFAFNNERYPIRYDVYLKMDNPLIIEGNGTETNPWADTDIDNLDSYAKFEKMFNDLMYQDPQMWDERVYEPIYGGFETQKVKLRFSNFSEKKQREIIKGIIDKLKAQGYDGIIIKNTRVDSLNPDEGINQYVVFEPNQIKSVYNRGTWNAGNDNIYYQNAEQVFLPTNRDKNTYISDLRAAERGEAGNDYNIRLGALPLIYQKIGIENKPVKTKKTIILKDTISKHDVPMNVVENLLELYSNPLMIFKSLNTSTNPDSYVAVLDAVDKNGRQMIAALSPSKKENGYHLITSFYGRNNIDNMIKRAFEEKKVRYIRDKKNGLLTGHNAYLSQADDNILYKSDIVNSFMQQKPQPKGLYDTSKGVIKIFESADFSTLPHEIAHYWLDNMWSYVRSGNASEKYRQRWNVIANWLNVKPEQAVLTRGQQEKFARSYEQYLLNGDLPTPIIKGAFDDYDRWLKRVYGDMNRLNVRLSEDAVRFFQSMTTGILPPPRIRPSRKPREKMTTAEKLREQLGLQEQDRQEKETVKLVEEMEAARPKPDNIDARTVIVSNITEGETGKSRVYSREVERNIDALQEIADIDLDYNKIRLEEQAQRAADFVKNNLEDARKIIDGRKPAPENILDTAIRIAYEQEMLRIGDNAEYLRALKLHSSLQTLRGQEIVAERISTKDIANPTYWINKLVAHRTYKAASKIFKGYAEAIGGDSPVDLYKKMIKNETDRITKKVLAEKTREEQQKVLNAELKHLRYEYGTGVQGELFQMPLEPLNARNAKMYVREALDDIFGTTVSQEEANQIIGKIGEIEKSIVNTLDETGNPSVQTWQKINEMNNLVESLTPSPALQIATSIVGRGMMLSSVKSPVLNVVSNTENILTEMLIRRAVNSLEGGASFSAVDKNVEKDYLAYADDVYRASGYNVSTTEGLDAATVTLGERRISTQGAGKFRAFARGVETGVFKYLMGYPDSRAKDFVFSDTAALEATTIAQNEGLSGEMLSKRATELYRDATRVAPLTEEGMLIREKAMIEANVATYTNDTAFSKFALGIRETLNKVTGNVRLGDQLMPFVKTPANVVALGMEYSIGAAYLIPNLTTVIRDVKAGKLSVKSRTAIKAAVRNGLGVVLAMLIAMALDPDDYTPDYDALTMSERRLALEKNAVFNSIRIGDKYISLDYFGPLAVPLTAVLSARRRGEVAWFGYAKGVASQLQKLPGLQEFSETVDAIGRATSNKPEKTVKNLNNALIDFVRARTIPSIVNDLAKSIDTYERETSAGTYDKAKASIPGIRESLPLKYTTTSKTPRETEPAWSTVLFGARVKTAASNRVIYEIDRLYKKGAKPTITDVTRSGKLSELSEAKQQRVRKEFAKRYYAEVYTLIRTRAYRAKDDEQKAAAINKVRRQIIEQLKKTYIR